MTEPIRLCECGFAERTSDYYCPDCGEPFFPNATIGSDVRPAGKEGKSD